MSILPEYERRGKELEKLYSEHKDWESRMKKLRNELQDCHKSISNYKHRLQEAEKDDKVQKFLNMLS